MSGAVCVHNDSVDYRTKGYIKNAAPHTEKYWYNLHLTCRKKYCILYIVFIAREGMSDEK
jgi:hypothetical protein